ncbi:psbP-like protein 1, chloroplastic [Physcomitrium patens]|uniref:PsbP C-terminal domain-containing protein n=1 Tax=Physcomitrium patens TaxID=3218 RepID=A0A2K1L1B1_PHYPA|nr:psbP-like protein 1, chloroplastic [Physcomitrium patens]PNR59820.1 hypothetical protein PHYPA_002612 [Physcomitrium patens]|eukprot:XP_024360627.1 psbP-like protein 1, chloroplastic [Physcomitrella patens]
MAALQISSSLYSSLGRGCTTSVLSHETVAPARVNGVVGNSRSRAAVSCIRASTSESCSESEGMTRRHVLGGAAAVAATIATFGGPALALNAPKGYTAVLDNADGYKFFYPFGWQEVAVKGQDVAFKDVIEPLESVSVSIIKTDKSNLSELGSADEVAKALVERVLASPTQKTKLVEAKERVNDGISYYTFEFMTKASNFTRHGLGTVAIKDGKFYTLTTGANERRWNKMSDKLKMIVNSFELLV